MSGCLYLLPASLAPQQDNANLALVIPIAVQQQIAELDYFIVENAKTARAFLKQINQYFPLKKTLQELEIIELPKHANLLQRQDFAKTHLQTIKQGRDGGLLSEAGVPVVADPGAQLIQIAHQQQIIVKPLVGPCSILLALMGSGLNGQSFAFHGYLPIDANERAKKIIQLEKETERNQQTQIFIETPYRNQNLLKAILQQAQPRTLLSVASNLSLSDERIYTLSVQQWRELDQKQHLPELEKKPTVFLLGSRTH